MDAQRLGADSHDAALRLTARRGREQRLPEVSPGEIVAHMSDPRRDLWTGWTAWTSASSSPTPPTLPTGTTETEADI